MSCESTQIYLERMYEEIKENTGRLMRVYQDLFMLDLLDHLNNEDIKQILILCNKIESE